MSTAELITRYLAPKTAALAVTGHGGIAELDPQTIAGALVFHRRDGSWRLSTQIATQREQAAVLLILYLYADHQDVLGRIQCLVQPQVVKALDRAPPKLAEVIRAAVLEYSNHHQCPRCGGKGEVWRAGNRTYPKHSLQQAHWLKTNRGTLTTEECAHCGGTGRVHAGWSHRSRSNAAGISWATYKKYYAEPYQVALNVLGDLEREGMGVVWRNLRD